MTAFPIQNTAVPSMAAFGVAVGVHVAVAFALLWMPSPNIVPPQVTGGFEVVDLSAFGASSPPEPEPEVREEEPIEEAKIEPTPEPIPEPIPEPEPEPEPEPIPEPKVEPAPPPKPVVKPKPKPEVKAQPKPKPVVKPQPKPVQKVKPKPIPDKSVVSAPGSQKAFVPPSSTAAYLRNPKPFYPRVAQLRGMQGVVLLAVEVSAKGAVLAVSIKKSSGFRPLDGAALKAVRAWRFAPAKRGGVPVAATVEVPIRFTLNDA